MEWTGTIVSMDGTSVPVTVTKEVLSYIELTKAWMVKKTEPVGDKTETEIDTSSQKTQLLKELEYHRGFLQSVEKKLSNERFVQNAKSEVIDIERKKKADAEAKIKAIEESLAGLN